VSLTLCIGGVAWLRRPRAYRPVPRLFAWGCAQRIAAQLSSVCAEAAGVHLAALIGACAKQCCGAAVCAHCCALRQYLAQGRASAAKTVAAYASLSRHAHSTPLCRPCCSAASCVTGLGHVTWHWMSPC